MARRAGRIVVMAGVAGRNVAAAMRQTAPRALKRRKKLWPRPPPGETARNAAHAPMRQRVGRLRAGIAPRVGTAMRSRANLRCAKPPCVTCRPGTAKRHARIGIIATATGAMIWARPCRALAIRCRPSC